MSAFQDPLATDAGMLGVGPDYSTGQIGADFSTNQPGLGMGNLSSSQLGQDPMTGGVMGVPPTETGALTQGLTQGYQQQQQGGGDRGLTDAIVAGSQPGAGPSVTAKHGGLLTGLAGVLIDGLAAGLAPNQTAAMETPMRIQQMQQQRQQGQMRQQQMQMQQQKLQEELAQGPARAQAMKWEAMQKQMTAVHMMDQMKHEDVMNSLGMFGKVGDAAIKQGIATPVATATNLDDAMKQVQDMVQKDPNSHPGIVPNQDGSQLTIIRSDPKGVLKEDIPLSRPGSAGTPIDPNDPSKGMVPGTQYDAENITLKKGMDWQEANLLHSDFQQRSNHLSATAQQATKDYTAQQAAGQKDMGKSVAVYDPNSQQETLMNQQAAKAQNIDPQNIRAVTPKEIADSDRVTTELNVAEAPAIRYGNAISNWSQMSQQQRDADRSHFQAVMGPDIMGGKIKIGSVGEISTDNIPGLGELAYGANQMMRSDQFRQLSPQGQDMIRNYAALLDNQRFTQAAILRSPRAGQNIGKADQQSFYSNMPSIYDVAADPTDAQTKLGMYRNKINMAREGLLTRRGGPSSGQQLQARLGGGQQQPGGGQQAGAGGGGQQQGADLGAAPPNVPEGSTAVLNGRPVIIRGGRVVPQ
jgi:hypothetical protein